MRLPRAALGLAVLAAAAAGAQEPAPAAAPDPTVAPDSTIAPDSTAADSAPAPESLAGPFEPYLPDSTIWRLTTFRLERSAGVERIDFGTPDDPWTPPGFQTLAEPVRLLPSARTRELSVGPTVSSMALDGAETGDTGILLGSRSLTVPGTSGPHGHDLALSEIVSLDVVRGGAAALYGPDAAASALVARPAFPVVDDLLSRAFAEEGVDEYQRAGFQASRTLGRNAGFFLSAESRRVDGFFPGTKEVDRQFAGRVRSRLPGGLEGQLGIRRFETDGRFDDGSGFGPVTTGVDDWHASLYRATGPDRGALLEGRWFRDHIRVVRDSVTTERRIEAPQVRLTADLPDVGGMASVLRAEATRWRDEDESGAGVDAFWRGALALRVTRSLAGGAGVTLTARADGEEGKTPAAQGRAEAWWEGGPARVFAIASRSERFPDRSFTDESSEVRRAAHAGASLRLVGVTLHGALFATDVDEILPEPDFDDVRAHEPGPEPARRPDVDVRGVTGGLDTPSFALPLLSFLGRIELTTSYTRQNVEESDTGARLPRHPLRLWTGEGTLQRRFFEDNLLARARGRLTHHGKRIDESGNPVVDLWMTDVFLEGEVGDALFFLRFHDLLQRADEVEPGIRFPGFTRTYGITWRFRG